MPLPLAALIPPAIGLGKWVGQSALMSLPFFLMQGPGRRREAANLSMQDLGSRIQLDRAMRESSLSLSDTAQLGGLASFLQQRRYDPTTRYVGEASADALINQIMARHRETVANNSLRTRPSVAEQYAMRILMR
jgi:hypothetical protein